MSEIFMNREFLEETQNKALERLVEKVRVEASASERLEQLKSAEPFEEAATAAFRFADESLLYSLVCHLSKHRGNAGERTLYAEALAARAELSEVQEVFRLYGPIQLREVQGETETVELPLVKIFEKLLDGVAAKAEAEESRETLLKKFPFLVPTSEV